MLVMDSGRSLASPQYTLSGSSSSRTLRFLDDASPIELSTLFEAASPPSSVSFSLLGGEPAKPNTARAVGSGRTGEFESEELLVGREDRAVEDELAVATVPFMFAVDAVDTSTSSASPRFRLPIG